MNLGQLVITGLSGYTLTHEEQSFIKNENIGGVILFTKNYESPAQLAELNNSIQALKQNLPLLICTDHEGGRVVRFKHGFTPIPSMLELASHGSPKLIFEVASLMAHELRACGINYNLGPVCDVWNNELNKVIGDRAFGKTADDVSKYISSMIRGYSTNNLISCAKHFPGHGNTIKDSHFDLPVIDKTLAEIKQCELIPFQKAILSKVDTVMMAHLIVKSIDPELPCSLSHLAHELLRNEYKFKGVILSDDMQMQAITNHRGTGEAAFLAIKAGSDLIEYRDFNEAKLGLEGLKKGFMDGKISEKEISEKVARVQALRIKYLSDYAPTYIPDLKSKMNVEQNILKLESLIKNSAH